jgi:hypothetical protein
MILVCGADHPRDNAIARRDVGFIGWNGTGVGVASLHSF